MRFASTLAKEKTLTEAPSPSRFSKLPLIPRCVSRQQPANAGQQPVVRAFAPGCSDSSLYMWQAQKIPRSCSSSSLSGQENGKTPRNWPLTVTSPSLLNPLDDDYLSSFHAHVDDKSDCVAPDQRLSGAGRQHHSSLINVASFICLLIWLEQRTLLFWIQRDHHQLTEIWV